ncbi:MAG: RNA polymerase sigma factor [Myxococcales bacterium]|nr:RNA polymerase sigma factor [Myxococcales bacterium]
MTSAAPRSRAPTPTGSRPEEEPRAYEVAGVRVPIEFARAYREHHDRVWRCLAALGVPEAAIDDATQDVFVIAYRRLPDYDGRAPLRAWLYGIARNVALKRRDRDRKRGRLALVHATETGAREPAALPDEQVARSQAVSVVESCLERLDDDKRAVFVLAELEGLRAPEIADALGIKLNTVYSRLRAARAEFNRAVARLRARDARLERRAASPEGDEP